MYGIRKVAESNGDMVVVGSEGGGPRLGGREDGVKGNEGEYGGQ